MPAPQAVPPQDPNTFGRPPAQPQQIAVVYQAIAQALVGRIHGLLLILSAITVGIITIADPTVLRLYGAAGYGVFSLAGLLVLRK